ncbi:unnamed protein product [Prorocentrum cordatum]|uniref:Uncharacterized protein n=1 Tax=Prorocentrum cordatum TaxID=2364126 RepID=A0ABN9TN29_9DINO|nr:unnamed protein product [Polarella glacialis]
MQPLGRSRARAGTSWCLAAAAAAAWCSARCLVAPTGPAGLRPAPRADVARGYERGGAEGGTGAGADTHEGGSGGSEQDVLAMWDRRLRAGRAGHVGQRRATGGQPYQSGGHDTGSGQRLVGFGKHRDLTYQEALSQDPNYCDWVMRESKSSDASPMVMDFVHWLEQNVPSAGGGAPANGFDLGSSSDPSGWLPAVEPSGDAGQRLVGFGKHRDLTYQEALSQDPQYCDWVMRESKSSDATPMLMDDFAHWLEQNVPSAGGGAPANGFDQGSASDPSGWLPAVEPSGDSNPKVGFGKHKHLTYEEALVMDKRYCQWVVTFMESKEDPIPTMVEFAKWLRERGIEPGT